MSEPAPNASAGPALEAGAYEVIRRRLDGHAEDLRLRLERLDADRAAVFGGVETALLATARLTTENNCVPRDLASIGQRRFAFGYNVHLGLRTNMRVEDVFAVHDRCRLLICRIEGFFGKCVVCQNHLLCFASHTHICFDGSLKTQRATVPA